MKENKKLFIGSLGKTAVEHKLIIGENYDALKKLLAAYTDSLGKGLIDVIYIDPPYNKEKSSFIYRYKFTREGWLNMMRERLKLARKLLCDKGVIFISIDDNMHAYLKVLCDEIFGEDNFIGALAWESKTKAQNTNSAFNQLQPKVEYILLYTKGGKRRFNLIIKESKEYPEADDRGVFRWRKIEAMSALGMRGRKTMIYPILGLMPPKGKQWKWGVDEIKALINLGDVKIENNAPFFKQRPGRERTEKTEPFWAFFSKEFGTAASAKKELSNIIGRHNLESVKPVKLIKRLIFHSTDKNQSANILDFFAGSGTTGQAVMELNAEDGGNRRFILVTNNENCIGTKITRERLYRIINGEGSNGKSLKNNVVRVYEICKYGKGANYAEC